MRSMITIYIGRYAPQLLLGTYAVSVYRGSTVRWAPGGRCRALETDCMTRGVVVGSAHAHVCSLCLGERGGLRGGRRTDPGCCIHAVPLSPLLSVFFNDPFVTCDLES